jgi:hypothetical protein
MHSVSEESHAGQRCFALPMLVNDSLPRQRYNFPDRTKPSTGNFVARETCAKARANDVQLQTTSKETPSFPLLVKIYPPE